MERNITLDYFKLLLCLLVVAIHTNIADVTVWGWFVSKGFSRIAVPLFFIINGYFLAPVLLQREKFKKYIFHIALIYSVWAFIYFPSSLHDATSLKKIFFIILTIGHAHLWYLIALIWGALLLYLVRNVNTRYVLIVSFVLYFIGAFIQGLAMFDVDLDIPLPCYRNFLFFGFPFLFIGYFISKYKIVEKNYSIKVIIGLLILLLIFFFIEMYYIYTYYIDQYTDFYWSIIFLCPLLFVLVMRFSHYKVADAYISKLASSVYFVHMLVLEISHSLFGSNDLANFPVTILLAFIMSAGIIAINKRLNIFL